MYFLLFLFFVTTQSFFLENQRPKYKYSYNEKPPFFGQEGRPGNLGSRKGSRIYFHKKTFFIKEGRPGNLGSRIYSYNEKPPFFGNLGSRQEGRPGNLGSRNGSRNGSRKGFLQLIRAQNILPTFFLSFTGAVIQKNLWSKHFVTSSLATLGILSTSMIFNDLFDMPIDKINHPNRPLISGDVSVKQALWYAAFFVTGTEYIAQIMNTRMRAYIRCALLGVILYTPVLKRIPLVKNIFCASLVSLALGFSGNAETFSPILACATQHIFAGSLHNELLLDIRDREGDAQHKIATIPVLFGNKVAWYLAMNVLVINLLRLAYLLSWQKTLPLLLICLPMFRNLMAIPVHNYRSEFVFQASKDMSTPLFLSLLYFIILARK